MKVVPVKIIQDYDNKTVHAALKRLQSVHGLFVPYVKENKVNVCIAKASNLIDSAPDVAHVLEKAADNDIAVLVRNNRTQRCGVSLLSSAQDSFEYSEPKQVIVAGDRGLRTLNTIFPHEDNLVRTVCRSIEMLTKFVKRK